MDKVSADALELARENAIALSLTSDKEIQEDFSLPDFAQSIFDDYEWEIHDAGGGP